MTVGEFIYKIGFKTDQSSKGKAEGEIEGLAAKAKKLLGAIGIGFSIKGAFEAIKACVEVSSEVEEMQNKFDVVFRGMTEDIEEWAQSYADAIGRNSNTIKGYLADSQNLFVGMGMQREAGAKLSEQMVTLALDLASFNNLQETDAVNAMTKALMGESESAKTLGAVLNDNTRAQAMQTLGLTGTYQALDEATKMQVNYQAILNQSADAIGDCERSMGSYQSTLKQTQSKLEEVKTLVGQFFMPTFQRVLSYANQGLIKIRDWITKLQTFADKIGGTERLLSLLAATGAAVVVALNFKKIVSGAESLLKVLGKINLKTMAIIAVVALLALIVDDFINFMRGNDSVIGAVLEKAGIDVDKFRNDITKIWENIKTVLGAVWNGIKNVAIPLFQGIWNAVKKVFEDIGAIIERIAPGVADFVDQLANGDINTEQWESLGEAIAAIAAIIAGVIVGMKTFAAVQAIVNAVMAASPITWIILAIAALIAIIVLCVKHWDEIKDAAVGAWEAIKGAFASAAEWFNSTVIQPIVDFFTSLWTAITDTVGKIKDSVVDGLTTAIDWIKGLPAQAVQWGKDFIQGLIDGIKNKVNAVVDAVKGVAEKITSFLHFSVPDEGPLTKYESWMPDFMGGLAKGIRDNKDLVLGAINQLAGDIDVNLNGDGKPKPRPATSGVTPRTAAASVNNSSTTRTINQVNNFNNHFNGGERETQRQLSKSARTSAKDATAELARAITFA